MLWNLAIATTLLERTVYNSPLAPNMSGNTSLTDSDTWNGLYGVLPNRQTGETGRRRVKEDTDTVVLAIRLDHRRTEHVYAHGRCHQVAPAVAEDIASICLEIRCKK